MVVTTEGKTEHGHVCRNAKKEAKKIRKKPKEPSCLSRKASRETKGS